MSDEKKTDPEMPTDSPEPKYLIVTTAKQAPTWMPWATYAIVVFNTYLASPNGDNWFLYVVAAIATGMTYMFHNTYRALVTLYNQMRVEAAVRQVQGPDSGVYMAKGEQDKVATHSNESDTLARFKAALEYIQDKCAKIGDARDAAWRALSHDEIKATQKEHVDVTEAS